MDNQQKMTDAEVSRLQEAAARAAEEAKRAAAAAAAAVEAAEQAADQHADAEHEHAAARHEHAAAHDAVQPPQMHTVGGGIQLSLSNGALAADLAALDGVQQDFARSTGNFTLTEAQRMSMLGPGVRRLGFMEKVTDTAAEKPEFIPPFFNLAEMQDMARSIELLRAIRTTAQTIDRMAGDALLVTGNNSYQYALMYYGAVRDAARRNVPGAQELYRMLELFFRSMTRRTGKALTEKEIMRDAKAVLHGKKDGEVDISGTAKHETAATHTAIDDTYKPAGAFKETVSGAVCSACGTENPTHAKFCINCGGKLKGK